MSENALRAAAYAFLAFLKPFWCLSAAFPSAVLRATLVSQSVLLLRTLRYAPELLEPAGHTLLVVFQRPQV